MTNNDRCEDPYNEDGDRPTRTMDGMKVPTNLDEAYIMGRIKTQEFSTQGKKTTVCLTTLVNGFEIITSAACVQEGDYCEEIGQTLASKKAIDKVWELEGYAKQVALA